MYCTCLCTCTQVTDGLTYLHEAVKIIHNDLRCSNILVFQFPPADHLCLGSGVTSGCGPCLSSSGETCGVLVKVADMGICANPTTQKTKNKQGIRRYIPECLNFDATLTNKVRSTTNPCSVYTCTVCMCVTLSSVQVEPYSMYTHTCTCTYSTAG